MYKAATFVFWSTLILYLITLFTVSYVGVYLTYVALPVIVVSGLVMKFSRPREAPPSAIGNAMQAFGNGLHVFATELDKVAADAERASAKLRADAEADRASTALMDARKRAALRRAAAAKANLSADLNSNAITRDDHDRAIAELDQHIAAIKRTHQSVLRRHD